MPKKRQSRVTSVCKDWPRSIVVLLALLLVASLAFEAWLLFAARPAFFDFTGHQSSGTVSLAVESDLPVVSMSKTDSPDPVNTSQQLNYTILLNNTGPSTAWNITVNETYPPEVVFDSSSPALVNNVTLNLSNLSAGEIYRVNITVNVSSTVGNATVINNTVNLTFFSTLNTKHSSVVTINTTVSNGSTVEEPAPGGDVGGGSGGGGGGGGGGCALCIPGSAICSPDGRKVCYAYGSCAKWELAPCAVGSTCSAGLCVPCTESWVCGDWSPCSSDGIETRDCFDVVGCGTEKLKPAVERACIPSVIELPDVLKLVVNIPPFNLTRELVDAIPFPVLVFVIGLGVLFLFLLPFGLHNQLEKYVLYLRLMHARALLHNHAYALAHDYVDKTLKPYLHSMRMDPRSRLDRRLFRMYYGVHRDLAYAYEQMAKQAGDKAKQAYWKKQAIEYAMRVSHYE